MQLTQKDLQLAISPKTAEPKRPMTPCEVVARPRDISRDPPDTTTSRRRRFLRTTPRAQTSTSCQRRVPCETSVTLLALPQRIRATSSTTLSGVASPRTTPRQRTLSSFYVHWSKGSKSTSGSESAPETEPASRWVGNHVQLRECQYPATWDGHVVTSREYDVLINKWQAQGLRWVSCSDGQMCSRAVQSGLSRFGEPVYIARTLSPVLTQCLGIFRPSTGLCYIPWRGKEVTSSTYELLCHPVRLPARLNITTLSPTTIISPAGLKILTLRNPVRPSSAATFTVQ